MKTTELLLLFCLASFTAGAGEMESNQEYRLDYTIKATIQYKETSAGVPCLFETKPDEKHLRRLRLLLPVVGEWAEVYRREHRPKAPFGRLPVRIVFLDDPLASGIDGTCRPDGVYVGFGKDLNPEVLLHELAHAFLPDSSHDSHRTDHVADEFTDWAWSRWRAIKRKVDGKE